MLDLALILLMVAFCLYILLLIVRSLQGIIAPLEIKEYTEASEQILRKAKDCNNLHDLKDLVKALKSLQDRGFNTVDLYHQVQPEVRGLLIHLIETDYSRLYAETFKNVVEGLHLCIEGDSVYEALTKAQLSTAEAMHSDNRGL